MCFMCQGFRELSGVLCVLPVEAHGLAVIWLNQGVQQVVPGNLRLAERRLLHLLFFFFVDSTTQGLERHKRH